MTNTGKLNYRFIDTESELENIIDSLEKKKTIAFDLEADSMFHYKEKVCLVQLSTDNDVVVIDPLSSADLSLLKPIFFRHDIKKVFHGADYDIRCLYRDFAIEINNLFDTQLACRFLGTPETGLNNVIKKRFNINLDKKYQKKDWSKRPLPEKMIQYAASDTFYLLRLAGILEKELEKKGRIAWVLEECEILSRARPALSNNRPLYLSFKGAGRLRPKNLAALEALLQFRKKIAEKKDRPLFKVIGNNSVMNIAISLPDSLKRLTEIKALSSRQICMYGKSIIELIENTLKIAEKDLPVYPRNNTPVLNPQIQKRIKDIKCWRKKKAEQLGICPGLLCNNQLINSIALKNPVETKDFESIKGMKKWQKSEFSNELIAVLKKANLSNVQGGVGYA
ncbi:MAG TPA: ribonuclease D [Desulfobacteraceae bacterium]|nr:MAG: ribonuclease D [Deltaproteobacteria bacterium]HDL07792.1 ribonuclease D [Desulfobacteraceae bacterium]